MVLEGALLGQVLSLHPLYQLLQAHQLPLFLLCFFSHRLQLLFLIRKHVFILRGEALISMSQVLQLHALNVEELSEVLQLLVEFSDSIILGVVQLPQFFIFLLFQLYNLGEAGELSLGIGSAIVQLEGGDRLLLKGDLDCFIHGFVAALQLLTLIRKRRRLQFRLRLLRVEILP